MTRLAGRPSGQRRISVVRMTVAACGGAVGAFVAVLAAGAGHGSYLPAKLFFPYSMVSTIWTDESISALAMVGALVQMPLYSVAWDLLEGSRRAAVWLVVVHLVAFVVSMLFVPGFPAIPG